MIQHVGEIHPHGDVIPAFGSVTAAAEAAPASAATHAHPAGAASPATSAEAAAASSKSTAAARAATRPATRGRIGSTRPVRSQIRGTRAY